MASNFKMINVTEAMGTVNFVVLPKDAQVALHEWLERGFTSVDDIEPYTFECDIEQSQVLTRQPESLPTFGLDRIIGKRIEAVDNCLGTYGMGGCGILGFKFRDGDDSYWIVIGQWDCESHITMDGRVFTCAREKVNELNPWYYGFAKHPENSRDPFYNTLCSLIIEEVDLNDTAFVLRTIDPQGEEHRLEVTLQKSDQVYVIPDQTNLMC